jgi:hypothetical protein
MSKFKLKDGSEGSIIAEPYQSADEPDPQPAEDGKYYLLPGEKSTLLAWELFEEGVETYCAQCRGKLNISRAYILCSTSQHHFNVVV